MPELPEVEYVAQQLREDLVGRRIEAVEVRWERSIEGLPAAELAARLRGRRVVGVGRRGKYLLIEFDEGPSLAIHRRMSGNLYFAAPDADEPYARVRFLLDDGRALVYSDPRKFGRLSLLEEGRVPPGLAALGPEPLEPAFTPAALAARLAGRRGAIKALLLDQSVLAGLGNIYADEALFRAGLHPLRPGSSLSSDEVARLHAGIRGALETGIAHGGTTFGRHRDAYNEAGRNLEHVEVYRRTGQPCPRCGTPIERITVAQRGTHFCPHCQPAASC
ncbi:MAG TPA: bifunctional DNA-formamidopyrimidine glycosylase/DNA-(apurinic or apyrimidinic site) lyase [Ktedonobacterales bacterium]|nr:bifunctional DNA-formamidopyrimidine glycosylase/DNA-(apurinic or apyrimidinic site) lyase [Ktedonobacterales bacterium]